MKHIDLFSGIGGFALATEMVWDNVEHIFCDNEPFAQEILKKHWPNSPVVSDIRDFTINPFGDKHRAEQRSLRAQEEIQRVRRAALDSGWVGGTDTILTGGFPCQPFSQAGRRKGTDDDRHLWPQMLRVIREFRPRWVIAENVAGLLTIQHGMVFEQVCVDLERENYAVQAFVIPAVAVGAPHRRDRVWFVAKTITDTKRQRHEGQVNQERQSARHDRQTINAQNTISERSGRGMESNGQVLERQRTEIKNARPSWEKNWIEVATRLCRVDDGVPRRMDRNPRLKALGNAIVPQVAAEIMKVIKEIDSVAS